jgi:hypothetical protein
MYLPHVCKTTMFGVGSIEGMSNVSLFSCFIRSALIWMFGNSLATVHSIHRRCKI